MFHFHPAPVMPAVEHHYPRLIAAAGWSPAIFELADLGGGQQDDQVEDDGDHEEHDPGETVHYVSHQAPFLPERCLQLWGAVLFGSRRHMLFYSIQNIPCRRWSRTWRKQATVFFFVYRREVHCLRSAPYECVFHASLFVASRCVGI